MLRFSESSSQKSSTFIFKAEHASCQIHMRLFMLHSSQQGGCGAQLEKERATAEEARQQLGERDALIRELSKDSVQVDKERYLSRPPGGSVSSAVCACIWH